MHFDTNVCANVEVDWTYHLRSYARIYVLASNRIATLMDADALFRGYAVVGAERHRVWDASITSKGVIKNYHSIMIANCRSSQNYMIQQSPQSW